VSTCSRLEHIQTEKELAQAFLETTMEIMPQATSPEAIYIPVWEKNQVDINIIYNKHQLQQQAYYNKQFQTMIYFTKRFTGNYTCEGCPEF
jgi:hypothetical protein